MDVETTGKHKFLESSDMTFQEVFDFTYKKLVPILQGLAKELGEDRFWKALEKVSSECALKAGQDRARQLPNNDLAAFIDPGGEPSHFGKHVLTREIVEYTPHACELKVTECLWAKTFREMGAADIGYLLLCNTDHADCQGFNPRITLIRSKTLMQGDDCCNHRFVWEG
jgi:hypothetical protein